MPITVTPITPNFGAEVSGLDLTRPLDEAMVKEVVDAMDRYGVCVYRNTGLTDTTHIAFSSYLGPLFLAPRMTGRTTRHKDQEIFDASNLDSEGNIVADEMTMVHKRGDRQWHTDSSFDPSGRASYSLLLAHEVPPEGGQTHFADTRSAYAALPQATKDKIENLVANHSIWWSRLTGGLPITEEEIDKRPSAEHRIVQTHKGSGRKTLYVASHARYIKGMPKEEGQELLRELIAFATQPQFTFSVTYKVGDLVIWDNRCTMHRGGEYDDRAYRRDMRRTTVKDVGVTAERTTIF